MEKDKINILGENNQLEKIAKERIDDKKPNEKSNNLVSDKPERKERYTHSFLREVLETTRPVKVTKGGRRFSFTVLVLIKDKEKKTIAYGRAAGKDTFSALKKAHRKAQKSLIAYFPTPPRTIPRDILVKYKSVKIFLKPSSVGSGIKAGKVLSTLFKFLEIKDVSAKIIASQRARKNKPNILRAAFLALDKLTGKKYEY